MTDFKIPQYPNGVLTPKPGVGGCLPPVRVPPDARSTPKAFHNHGPRRLCNPFGVRGGVGPSATGGTRFREPPALEWNPFGVKLGRGIVKSGIGHLKSGIDP